MPNVLLTGASGFLGQHLARELLATGARVRALSRRDETDRVLAALGRHAGARRCHRPGLAGGGDAGIEAVFHAAADTSTWRPNNAAQTRTNVGGAQNLVAAAREAEACRAFVHTSSVSAYSHLVHGTLREDVPQRGGDSWINYERTKFLAEQAVRESGLPFIISQPSHILGPGDTRNWSRLIRLVDQGKLPGVPPASGAFADVREIAKAQVRGLAAAALRRVLPDGRRAGELPGADHAGRRDAGQEDADARDAGLRAACLCAGRCTACPC